MPGIGAQDDPYLGAGQLTVGVNYRYQYSDRHFVGDREQPYHQRDGTAVQNTVHLFDASLTYAVHRRCNISLGVPYLIAERSTPLFVGGVPDGRTRTHAYGPGDISLVARVWVLDPERYRKGNFSLGLGLKIPTGDPGKLDLIDNGTTRTVGTVDQSIQPGDGGWGATVDLQAFLRSWQFTFYLQGLYLFNPRNINGVPSGSAQPGEQWFSVADSYLAAAGVFFAVPRMPTPHGLAIKVGLRTEGVPARDAFGGSDGFRRPGVAVSIDPGLSYVYDRWAFGLSVPVAVYRNRQASVADELNQTHGDGAFADYLILGSVTRVFGERPPCDPPK